MPPEPDDNRERDPLYRWPTREEILASAKLFPLNPAFAIDDWEDGEAEAFLEDLRNMRPR